MSCLSIFKQISTLFLIFFFFFFLFRPSIAYSNSTFSFPDSKDPNFKTQIAFFGDSKLVVANNRSGPEFIQLTSSGRVIYRKPIKLIEGKPQKSVSFSSHFSFSLQPARENETQSLAFVLVPTDFDLTRFYSNESFGLLQRGKDRILRVKFTTLDGSGNGFVKIHAGVDVVGLVSAKVRNVSTVDLTVGNGDESHAWVDYEASSKRLEVRVSRTGGSKPVDPLFWYQVDLSKLWQSEEALVGFFSNSSRTCSIHSWGFEQRHVPQSIHSQPLDPNKPDGGDSHSKPMRVVEKKRDCLTKILGSMIFGVACGALTAFMALYLWSICGHKRPVVPEESVGFEYKKVKVVVDNNKAIEDGSTK